jgi:hypothetical protein
VTCFSVGDWRAMKTVKRKKRRRRLTKKQDPSSKPF